MRVHYFTIVIMILMSFAVFADYSIPVKYQGVYPGVSIGLISSGASYENSLISFRIEEEGLFWTKQIGGKAFEIFYPNSWLIVNQASEDFELAIKQSQYSELAQIILNFSKSKLDANQFLVSAYLGEGIPMPLGVFNSKKGLGAEEVSRKRKALFKAIRSKSANLPISERVSHLISINMEHAERVIKSGELEEKISVIKEAGHSLWTGADIEVNERIELIKSGLMDSSPSVQVEALEVFTLGGRVTDSVAIVVGLLDNAIQGRLSLQKDVLDKAVSAATILLYESYSHQKQLTEVRLKFGTTDIKLIHKKTGGMINAADVDGIEYLAKERSNKINWTGTHLKELRRVLNLVKESQGGPFSEFAKVNANRGLVDYPEISGSDINQCTQALGG